VALFQDTAPKSAKSTRRSVNSIGKLRTRNEGIPSAGHIVILLVIILAFMNVASRC
jgi:hypothetical protein